MFTITQTHRQTENKRCLDLIYSITTNNLSEVRKLVTEQNVNNVIEFDLKMTALHYAATQLRLDSDIEKFLLSLGGNPNIKNVYNQDSYDISMKCNRRSLFDHKISSLQKENKDLSATITTLGKRNRETEEHNIFLSTSCNNYKEKHQKLEHDNKLLYREISDVKIQNSTLTRDLIVKDTKITKLSKQYWTWVNG